MFFLFAQTTHLPISLMALTVCLASGEKLFHMTTKGLGVAPDLPFFLNQKREEISFSETFPEALQPDKHYIESFNIGLMLVDFSKLPKNTFSNLLDLVNTNFFSKIETGHTDQYLLSRYFKETATLPHQIHLSVAFFKQIVSTCFPAFQILSIVFRNHSVKVNAIGKLVSKFIFSVPSILCDVVAHTD